VTRKGANLYKVDGQQIYIRTNYCYEYAYGESAILEATGGTGDLKFLESKDECPVKAILSMSQQAQENIRSRSPKREMTGMRSSARTCLYTPAAA
jgi:hypothetical protein